MEGSGAAAPEKRLADLIESDAEDEDFEDEKVIHVAKKPRLDEGTELEEADEPMVAEGNPEVAELVEDDISEDGSIVIFTTEDIDRQQEDTTAALATTDEQMSSAPASEESPEEPIQDHMMPVLAAAPAFVAAVEVPEEATTDVVEAVEPVMAAQELTKAPIAPTEATAEATPTSQPADSEPAASTHTDSTATPHALIADANETTADAPALATVVVEQAPSPTKLVAAAAETAVSISEPVLAIPTAVPSGPATAASEEVPAILPLFLDDSIAPTDMEPYDPDEYEMPAADTPADSDEPPFELPPCVHQSVVDLLTKLQATEPSIVFDERTLLAMNALTAPVALTVMTRFVEAVAASAVPPDTFTTLRDLIAVVKAEKPTRDQRKADASKALPLLADAVLARLLDCQADPASEFSLRDLRSSNVLDTLAALPPFAQLTIVARFTKSALPTIRAKDAHLTQLVHAYKQENPSVATLRHVSEMVPSHESDKGLFDYGYAPPQPAGGMLATMPHRSYPLLEQLRAQKDKLSEDEFGRVKAPKPASKLFARAAAVPSLVTTFRQSDMYPRLSPAVREAMEEVYASGSAKEVVNDTVLLRLMKLPDHLALRAVENFRSTDTTHVDNIHGFFVGIITRVVERERTTTPTSRPFEAIGRPFAAPPLVHVPGPAPWAHLPVFEQYIRALPLSVQTELTHMVASGVLSAIDELAEKCYEILGQLSEPLCLEVLNRYTTSNLDSVRNRSGFLIGVVKRVRQEYGLL
ncbi:hypothetical protein ACHHYP_04115 [Achlya hypogyna]|uniref:Heterogeneous nuclear ribonucleoprotein Q acidic domain-containing protein n=1 Tax=Achlya hypogyna TaxID=1202772 RepID=A0A1V9Z1Z3_ACHHY|nr:hypothetical protein ACHHYP_04115 [Achlya hypogyna]